MSDSSAASERVLIVAPTGNDAGNLRDVLRRGSLPAEVRANLAAAADRCDEHCGALVLAEEAFTNEHRATLIAALARQPPWSELPIIIITSERRTRAPIDSRTVVGPRGNVTLLERPLRAATLIATVDAALRARRRQFEVRDLLAERDALLDSLEKRVRDRTEKLQAMVSEMEAFSYSVSHDLRSPLRVLSGYAKVLLEDHAREVSPRAREYLFKIHAAAERMDQLTQDLLAYTRVASTTFTLEPVDLDELMDTVIEAYPSLREARAHLQVRGPLGRVLGHSPSLVQCFSNLLENALKFSAPGKPPRVEVFAETRNRRTRVSVRDDGPGIDPADQDRIFGAFERAAKPDVPGTGMGLAIVQKAVQRMKGSVGVESRPGAGARFWLELETAP